MVACGATEKVALTDGWRFVKADDPSAPDNLTQGEMSLILDAVNHRVGPKAKGWCQWEKPTFAWAAPDFDDSTWKPVRVPHDWGVERSFDPKLPYGDAYLDVTGVGWYRLAFDAPAAWKGKTVYFECDGAMSYAMMSFNGEFVGGWPYGYTRWRVDLTGRLKCGARNVIAIRCHNLRDSSRWYTGGGLYRECRLLVCPTDHVVPGSVFITTPKVSREEATVSVKYEMSVSGPREKTFTVAKPRLWDVDDPYLYSVDVEGDTYRYGIRTISFHADARGFQLNGRRVPLNGVSMHHDFGVLGAAWNRAAQRRRLVKFKAAGVNAIRSSHNPPDEGLLELCDELGLLVKDEVFDEWWIGARDKRSCGYSHLFGLWSEHDVRAWVRTDRNHPCVIMYSIGNEIVDGYPDFGRTTADFIADAKRLSRFVNEEDPTRPTTNANNNNANYTNDFPKTLPLLGCNYYSWQYGAFRRKYPDVPFFASESQCMSVTRGEFGFPVRKRWPTADENPKRINSSYCWEAGGWTTLGKGWACPPDVQWHYMDQYPDCLGEFIWTGVDYLGGPYWISSWKTPIHTCNVGFLDSAGFRKDSFYLYQSRWLPDKPMAHILPHWNWKGREGEVTPVYVFTSGDEGELFLNGKSQGVQRKQPGVWDRAYRLCWDEVRYAPGRLEVVVRKNGKEWARDVVETTGPAVRLELESETSSVVSDGQDIAFVNVSVRDAEGRVVPATADEVTFAVEGPAEILATDNGDERDFGDIHAPRRKVLNGWAQALVRAKRGATGTVTVKASAPGLAPAAVRVAVKSALPRSCIPGGYGGEKWKAYRERFEAELATAKAGGAPVVFLGDSITHNWEEPGRGKEVWERHFASGRFRAVNFGIKGDSTCNLIYRLQRGVLDGFKAKAVVLQIGTNNLKNDSPGDIRLGVKACLDLIRAKQPDATVVLHPVPMCASTPDAPMRRQAVAANAELAKLADSARVVWCEWSQRMLLPDGTIPKSMIPDTCHPLRPGYELWAEALLPVLEKILPEEGALVIRGGGGALSVDPVYGDILPGSDGVFRSGDLGLWSVKFKSGTRLSASEFRKHPEWRVERTGNRFVFREGHADVTVEFVGGPDGVDVRGTVVAKKDDPVLSFELPARLWFDPAKVDRFYMPQRGNGGMGFALKRSFFEETSKLRYPSWRQVGPRPWKRNPPEERTARVAAELKSAVRASDRPKVGFVRCPCGPEWGSGDSLIGYRRKLDGELRAAKAEVEVVNIGSYAELVAALKDDRFRLVLNPYGDLVPMRGAGDIAPTVAAVRDYVARGGRWVSAVDVAEITAFVPGGYLSYAAPYPNLFMDFCHLRTVDGGDVSVYGVRPRPAHKAWENPPEFHFVPGSLACGGAARGGYVDHTFAVYGVMGRPFAVPAVRFAFGRRLQEAVDDYARANDLTRPLADKIPAERLATLKRAALVTMYGSRADRCAEVADRLPPPALVHISSYLKGGFDKEYPDHLPSNAARFGTDAEHRAFIDRLRVRGHLYMPYTNPTWWCDHPRGPTFQAAGEAPLLIGADGRHNHEVYKQDGWTTCFWHPAVIAANRRTVSQFLTDLPVDILFQDQCGARRCPYDFNPAAPSPVAYSEGLLSQVEEDAARVPLGTEDGWDRVANEEICLCGVSWQTIPRHLDFRKSDYRPLQKELASPETWEIEPLAARLMHEKCLFYCHDLSGSAFCSRLVAWDLAMGYNLSVDASPGKYLRKADVRTWCEYVMALQRHVASKIAGQPLREWRHDRAPLLARTDIAATDRRDDGVVTARWGEVRCVVNLGDVPRTVGDVRLAPYGYVVEGPGFRADYLEGRSPRLTGEVSREFPGLAF